jgi:hypothetical protein
MWSASGSGSHATSSVVSVAGRSANQRTAGTSTKETKDARQNGKETERERGRCGGSRRAAHPFIHCVCVQVQVSARPSATKQLCVVARGAIGCAGSTLFCPTLAHAPCRGATSGLGCVWCRSVSTCLRYATLRYATCLPGEAVLGWAALGLGEVVAVRDARCEMREGACFSG